MQSLQNEGGTATLPDVRDLALYHSDTSAVSQSQLKVLDASPAEFYARFVAGTLRDKDSPDKRLGRCIHAKILQPDLFNSLCPMMPDFHLNGNVDAKGKPSTSKSTSYYQEHKREFELANAGKDIIDADEYALVRDIANAVWRHEDAHAILSANGENEVQHRWEDRIKRRGMMDADRVQSLGIIADVKTMTGTPDGASFSRNAAQWKHYIQAPYYLDLANDLHGLGDYRFLFICVNKQPPHEVAIHELTTSDMVRGEDRVETLVSELLERRESGNWQAPWQRGITETPLPAWVWSNFYSVED